MNNSNTSRFVRKLELKYPYNPSNSKQTYMLKVFIMFLEYLLEFYSEI